MTSESGKLKIDKNIPAPKERKHKYPFDEMKDGDSFLYPCLKKDSLTISRKLYSAAYQFCKREENNLSPILRIEEKGVRVWLVKK